MGFFSSDYRDSKYCTFKSWYGANKMDSRRNIRFSIPNWNYVLTAIDLTNLTPVVKLHPMSGGNIVTGNLINGTSQTTGFMDELVKDQYWTNCQTVSTGRQVTKILTGLTPRTTYKFQVRSTSDYGNTDWSEPQIFLTSLEKDKEIYKRVKLFARGTSAVNHDEAIIQVDNNIILQKANFKGLYLAVLNRLTLKLEYTSNNNDDIYIIN